MVQLIMGLKGSGKTKRLVEMVATAVREETGSVVCIEKDKKLTYDIPYQARLIYACDYANAMGSYDFFKGFLSGLACRQLRHHPCVYRQLYENALRDFRAADRRVPGMAE